MATTASRSVTSSMSSSPTSSSFTDVSQAQDHIHAQFNLEDPVDAISSYARVMREHTQRQMERARSSARRRSPESVDAMSTLTQESSMESVDSRGSA